MKKTLIALAVAGVVVAPAAMADVTVYGQAHVSVGQDNDGKKSFTVVNSNSSRFGIKASESLDGGLTAVAQMEFGVAMSDSYSNVNDAIAAKKNTNVTARNQFVGLAGGFGTILAGRHDAPNKMSTGGLDIFADTVADYNAVIGLNGATDVRADNAIAYVAPAIAGATIVVAYVPSTTNEHANAYKYPLGYDDSATSAAVMWTGGPLTVDVGYLATGKGFDLGNAAAGIAKDAYSGTPAEVTDLRVGVGYQITDALKVAGIYNTVEAKVPGGGPDVKFTNALLNGAFSLGGGNTVKAEYGMMQDDTSGATKGNSSLLAIGLDHAFSKNTSAYVVYASMSNEENARAYLGVNGSGASIIPQAAGKDPSALEVGMVVKF